MTYGIFTAPRKQKRKLTIHDVNRMETVREDRPKNETLKSFTAKENARIAAEQAAKESEEKRRQYEAEAPVRERSRRLTLYWRQALSEISINGVDMTPVDNVGEYAYGTSNDQAVRAAYREFAASLKSQGCSLSPDGWKRLGSYLASLEYHRQVSRANVANWTTALDRCIELNIFADGEITGYRQPTIAIEQPRQPELTQATKRKEDPLVELESLSLETREGSRRGREIVAGLVGDEERAAWQQFQIRTLQEIGRELTPPELLVIFNAMKHRGLDFRNPKHLRLVVVALCHSGELPAELLSEQDKLNAFIDRADLSDITVRQKINQWQRQIDEAAQRKSLGY
jgi:hypothetical protein